MSGRKLRSLGFGLVASAGAGLLTLTAMMNSAFAYGQIGDTASSAAEIPVQLTAYTDTISNAAADAASAAAPPYETLFASLPSLPPLPLGLNIPGVEDVFINITGVLPWDYAFGAALGNAGGLGIQAWDPSNPLFTFVAESVGTTGQPWPGVASLVGIETLLGGFTNTESYANTFDPTNTTCIICDTFTLLGPFNTPLFSWTSDIPLGGSPQFELTTPLANFGPELGNAFDYSPLANNFDPPAVLAGAAGAAASLVGELGSPMGSNVGADLSALLPNVGTEIGDVVNFLGGPVGAVIDLELLLGGLAGNPADLTLLAGNVGADLDASLLSTLSADLGTLLPTLLANLIP
jgi:hypothetical protein